MISTETIIALSSAPGVAARAIVRLSGSMAIPIANAIAKLPATPGAAQRCLFHIQSWEFSGTVYFFREPRSYTGENLIEFHLPGNSLLCDRLIKTCVQLGARMAEPGEFTARAFFNGKMDLTQAEGVAATIAALNQRQLTAARQLMAGELTRRTAPITELIAETLALIEAGIDFVDEDVSFISSPDLANRLNEADQMLRDLVNQSARFAPLGAEPTVALIGRPNAGKSTLLNALAQSNRAIVSPTAGTTRDALSADVVLPHGLIKLIDIPGIDESPPISTHPPTPSPDAGSEVLRRPGSPPISQPSPTFAIHHQMQSQARRTAESADVIIRVIESLDNRPPLDLGRSPDILIRTKSDLADQISPNEINICAPTGAGLDHLRQILDRHIFGDPTSGAALTLNTRHLHAISETRSALNRARADAAAGHELLALHLRESLDHLGQITGTISPDDLLGKVFSKFCIGK